MDVAIVFIIYEEVVKVLNVVWKTEWREHPGAAQTEVPGREIYTNDFPAPLLLGSNLYLHAKEWKGFEVSDFRNVRLIYMWKTTPEPRDETVHLKRENFLKISGNDWAINLHLDSTIKMKTEWNQMWHVTCLQLMEYLF